MNKAFLINGLNIHNTAADDSYKELRDAISSKGYEVIPADITWMRTTPSQFVKKFVDLYEKNKSSEKNIVIGNSFGAVVAFISAAKLQPDLVLLCSLSPYFKEDLGSTTLPPSYYRRLGKRRILDIEQYSASKIAEEIDKTDVKVKVLYGELERTTSPRVVKRCISTAKKLKNTEAIEIKNAPHHFRDHEYVVGIAKEL